MKLEPTFRTTKTDLEIELRSAAVADAGMEIEYLKRCCGETRFLLSEPEDVNYTLEAEEKYIKAIEDAGNEIMINAYVNGEFVGNGSISPVSSANRLKHRCSLGIALFGSFCGQGIGECLMAELIAQARLAGYEIIELDVFAKNERARQLYKKMGFVECGCRPNAIKYKDGTYDDEVLMSRPL